MCPKFLLRSLQYQSSFLLPFLSGLGLRSFLAITSYHDYTKEAAHDSRADQDEDDRYPYRPNSGWEVGVERVIRVDKWLKSGRDQLAHVEDGITGAVLPSKAST